jgi:uncharacterized protein
VVGKAPIPGTTKTRLLPALSAEQAATLYRGFLLDALQLGLDLSWDQVSVIHPRGAGPLLHDLLPSGVHLLEETGSGLGEALAHAFQWHFAHGFDRVVLIGSDNPTLPPEPVHEACAALDRCDASLGPTDDGGYYLMGLRQAQPGLFEGIEWSTRRVYRQTLAQAAHLGLSVHPVAQWYDVDTPADLERLRLDLLSSPSSVAPNTRLALQSVEAAYSPGGTRIVGVRPERSAYAAAIRSAAERPRPD